VNPISDKIEAAEGKEEEEGVQIKSAIDCACSSECDDDAQETLLLDSIRL
jgi:hypothetical protein